MDNEIEKNLEVLIKNWFCSLNNNRFNDAILFLICSGQFNNLTELQMQKKDNLNIWNSSKYLNYKVLNNKQINHIIITQNTKFNFEQIDKKLLIIPHDHDFFKNMKNYITSESYIQLNIKESDNFKYWLQKENLLNLVQDFNSEYLSTLVKTKLKMLSMIDLTIIYNITDNNTSGGLLNENYYTDIEMLHKYKVFTSRLAIVLYRIAFLEFNANSTKIGREIHKLVRNKSKTFTVQMIKSLSNDNTLSISNDLIKKKSFKAYDLNVDEKNISIRIEIANNLLSYDIRELTLDKIAKSTNLSIEKIEELNKAFNL